jgi:glycosyltransferase involved in cell wall biosynthesis
MRKKILYVITKSNWGGAQRYVFDLATHLPPDEFEVAVAFGGHGRLAQELQKAGIKTYEIASLRRDVAFGSDSKSLFELRRLFKKLQPDIVHLNSSKVGGVGGLAARLAGVPLIVFTAHGWPFREQRAILAVGVLWLASWITALLSTKVICVSNYDLKQTYKMPFVGKKAVCIYNGIDQGVELGSGNSIRKAFPPGARITGTIGELNKNKNQQALIEEARKDPAVFVAIVGEGEERAALEAKIRRYNLGDRVKLFGFMPASEVLRGFDTFALPSLKEGLPYVLLEAKAAGLPIVANRVGGVGEILDNKNPDDFSLVRMTQKTSALYRKAS